MKISAILFASTLAFTSSVFSISANADNFGTGPVDAGWYADNNNQDYCTLQSYPSSWSTPMVDSMNNLNNQTQMTVSHLTVCASGTDVQFLVSDSATMGSTTLGSYFCSSKVSSNVCNASTLKLNSDLLTTATQRRKTACHEVGHSTGMIHAASGDDCMISGYYSYTNYNTHHVAHVDYSY